MSRYRATMKDLLEKVYKEDGHQDVSSSKRMCKTIVEDAQQIEAKLNSMSPEDSLDTWWTNKLAVSANNLNKARDYIVNDIKEAKIISDISGISIPKLKKEAQPFNVKVDRVTPGGFDAEYEVTFSGSEQSLIKYAKKHLGFDGNNFGQLKRHLAMEETDIEEISDRLKMKVKSSRLAQQIAKLKNTFLKKTIPGTGAMFAQKEEFDMTNEEIEIEEGKMKTIATMFDQGKSAEEIAKKLKLPTSTVKSILGEETELDEFTLSQINTLKKSYADMKGKTISPEKANALSKALDRLDLLSLRQLNKEKIPFISTLARNKIYRKTGKFEELELTETDITKDNVKTGDSEKEKELKIKLDKEKDTDALEKQLIAAQGQINILKQKLENEKNKALKPEPNRETGEVPLTVGVAYKHFKDKAKKEVKEESLEEMSPAEKKKRLQRAKDMIKYYDAIKKAALKGKNKELAKKMLKSDLNEARFEVEGRVDYKGVSGGDDFSIVVDAPNAKAAEKKVEDMLFKHRDQRKIGPRGGRGVDDYEIESVERTSKSVTNKFFTYHAAEKDPSIKEADLTKSQIKKVHDKADDLPKDSFRDRYGKKQGDSVRYAVATNMVKKKLGIKEDRRLYVETIAGLKKKAEKSGMPYSILKKVYDRGMAAWKGGHRPGASQQQWAFARVNSFVTKSSGTWGGADKDLAAKVRGSK